MATQTIVTARRSISRRPHRPLPLLVVSNSPPIRLSSISSSHQLLLSARPLLIVVSHRYHSLGSVQLSTLAAHLLLNHSSSHPLSFVAHYLTSAIRAISLRIRLICHSAVALPLISCSSSLAHSPLSLLFPLVGRSASSRTAAHYRASAARSEQRRFSVSFAAHLLLSAVRCRTSAVQRLSAAHPFHPLPILSPILSLIRHSSAAHRLASAQYSPLNL
ncbi:hypothetical protein R3P38DRAFT_3228618 [Favolaschia claudopus]|uniref:Uncharacterized protein n=1 Tax=Favolaschia claudopus TaxID=2862362 RepID=A0AAV9ZQG8_9AGAR